MFGLLKKRFGAAAELSARTLADLLEHDEAIVIDVREPDEFRAGHIAGAANQPLSSFDPATLPAAGAKRLILNCAGGKRSAMALDRCRLAHMRVGGHLKGGLAAWTDAGLPLVTGA